MPLYSLNPGLMNGELNVSLTINGRQFEKGENQLFTKGELVSNDICGSVNSGTKSDYDAVSNSFVWPTLYSEKFFEALVSVQAKGYKKVPINLVDKKGNPIEGFSALIVLGRSGPIIRSKCQPFVAPPPVPAGRASMKFKGIHIDESTWDGSDLFIPEGTMMTVITEKVWTVLLKSKLKNIKLTPLLEDSVYFSNENIVEFFGQEFFEDLKNKNLVSVG